MGSEKWEVKRVKFRARGSFGDKFRVRGSVGNIFRVGVHSSLPTARGEAIIIESCPFVCQPDSLCSFRSETLLMSGPMPCNCMSSVDVFWSLHVELSRPSLRQARTGRSRGWSQIFFRKVRATNGLRFDVNNSCRKKASKIAMNERKEVQLGP